MAIDYRTEVTREKVDFIMDSNVFDLLVVGLLDGDENLYDVSGLDDYIHEKITDRGYTTADATFVIEHCINEETDSGLWDSQKPMDAINTMAAYSFRNDVVAELEDDFIKIAEELEEMSDDLIIHETPDYEEGRSDLSSRNGLIYENQYEKHAIYVIETDDGEFADISVINTESGQEIHESTWGNIDGGLKEITDVIRRDRGTDIDEDEIKGIAKKAFATESLMHTATEFAGDMTKPEPGSEDEKELVTRWLRLADKAGMWSGSPVGSSYIDSRCGVGFGIPEVLEFVNHDRKMGRRLPHLRGKNQSDLVEYYLEKHAGPAPETAEEAMKRVETMFSDGLPNNMIYSHLRDLMRNLEVRSAPGM